MLKPRCTINLKELNGALMMLNMKKIVINAPFNRIFIFINHPLALVQGLIQLFMQRILLIKIFRELRKLGKKNYLRNKLNNKAIQ